MNKNMNKNEEKNKKESLDIKNNESLESEKVSTSIQYLISNITLFREVFNDWNKFKVMLDSGPETMKGHLLDTWNKLRKDYRNDDRMIVKDIDKEVTIKDFDITFNKTKNNTKVFFITFPDYEFYDAASKYVAIALTKDKPRYFTLEYSKHHDNNPCFVLGEFVIINNEKSHRNYGTIDNKRITWFAGYVMGKLEAESSENSNNFKKN